MVGYSINLEEKTLENLNFREVLFTGPYSQLVVMSLQPGEEIGLETHDGHDQFIRVERGVGEAIMDGEVTLLEDGVAIVVPGGVAHNIVNTSETEPLKLYTVYSPAEHPDKTVHKNKAEADAYELEHHS
jgi:mannose-6-phosphate isomerase-like protein (cupin superfamily)